jgi:hypothetical protein
MILLILTVPSIKVPQQLHQNHISHQKSVQKQFKLSELIRDFEKFALKQGK